MKPLPLVVLTFLLATMAGCLDGDRDGPRDVPTDPGLSPSPLWRDVRAAPEGYGGSEVSMAVDPNDPLHIVASAHSGGFGVYESFDGGQTFDADRLTPARLFPTVAEGPSRFLGFSDPAVAFGPDSTVYIAGLAVLPHSAVFVAKRVPGQDWTGHVVWESEIVATMNDKEWIGVNPVTGTVVVAWQRELALDQMRGVEQSIDAATGQRVDIDTGLIVFSRSTDGGATWSLPEQVGHGLHANGTQVAFAADGTGYMAWVDYEDPHLDMMISRDDGATWGELSVPSDISIVGSFEQFGRMHTLPGLAVDAQDVYLVWHDDRHGDADIFLAHFDGQTWNRHRVPDGLPGDGNIQLYPWVAADNGTAHVTFYSARDGSAQFAYRHAAFVPGMGFGQISDMSNTTFEIFGHHRGGSPGNIGDYTAAAASGGRVYGAWADLRQGPAFVHVASTPMPSGMVK